MARTSFYKIERRYIKCVWRIREKCSFREKLLLWHHLIIESYGIPATECIALIPFGFEQPSRQWKLLSSLSSNLEIYAHQNGGGRIEKASIANSHSPCQAFHFPDSSASVSELGMYCSYITVQMNHKSNFHGTDHNLQKSHQTQTYSKKKYKEKKNWFSYKNKYYGKMDFTCGMKWTKWVMLGTDMVGWDEKLRLVTLEEVLYYIVNEICGKR